MRSAPCVLGVVAAPAGQSGRRPAAAAEARRLDLPQGKTALAEIGIYRIGYTSTTERHPSTCRPRGRATSPTTPE